MKFKRFLNLLKNIWISLSFKETYVFTSSGISAKVIADSKCGKTRLVTMVLVYPRFIHPQMLTHRVFSRNSASSRAVSIESSIQAVENNPVIPISWGQDQRGMVAKEDLSDIIAVQARERWLLAAKSAVEQAKSLQEIGLHKQICNRVLEPFLRITTIVTATNWDNFLELRVADDAQPEIQVLAKCIKQALKTSTPVCKKKGEYHLPFIKTRDYLLVFLSFFKGKIFTRLDKVSAARCARVSYLNHDGKRKSLEEDLAFSNRLLQSKHMSPFEHQAWFTYPLRKYQSNLRNVTQFRKFLDGG